MAAYEFALIIIALAILGTAVLPRLLEHRPLSFPIIYVGLGILLFSVVPGAPALNPVDNTELVERLTELVVIISLMGAGLKLDRPFSVRAWMSTWRLLGITLPLTAGLMAVLAWGVLGLLPATAILLGAVIAPTDPVLASGIEAGAPLTELEAEQDPTHEWGTIRFALTSEARVSFLISAGGIDSVVTVSAIEPYSRFSVPRFCSSGPPFGVLETVGPSQRSVPV